MPAALTSRIVLTGFMGSGKSTVGPLLAARLGWRFLDLDREIERRESKTISSIFETRGEAHFRSLETALLARLLAENNLVLGLGGGAVEASANRAALATPGTTIVYLEAPLNVLLARCRAQDQDNGTPTRPLLQEASTRFAERLPLYEQLAHHAIPTDDVTPDAIAARILSALTFSTG